MSGLTHIPVLLEEVLQNLITAEDRLVVDGTLGGGGHTASILERYDHVRVIGIDGDEAALEIARDTLRVRGLEDRATLVRGNFRDVKTIAEGLGVMSVDAVLLDLGTSVYQIMGKRGFSFYDDVDLDMRMDTREDLTAYDVVNRYREEELARILFEYGEEEKSRRIARAIVEARKKRPIATARELADLVAGVKWRRGRIHPATKTFQAIRIETNRELENLKECLEGATELLNPKGRIGVISFHSLEDRIVKETFKGSSRLAVLTKKPIRPERSEVLANAKARSAKLRIAEKRVKGEL